MDNLEQGGAGRQRPGHNTSVEAAHRRKIRQSALSDEQIDRLGWQSTPNGRLLIPYLKPDGSPEACSDGKPFQRWRLSDQEIASGQHKGKYRSPSGNGCRLYHSALAIAAGGYEERLQDRFTPLRITEGELKTEAANVHDPERLTVGIGGVGSWRDRRSGGDESQPLPELEAIPLKMREVRLCFDSDFRKKQVAAELCKLARYLSDRKAIVLIEVLPNGLDGERLGLDDLIYRHGPAVFREVAAIARSPFKWKKIDGEWVELWEFDPEPRNTRERNAYLFGMLGRDWRCGSHGKDHWQQWTGSHWADVVGDDAINRQIERFAVLQDWQNRELSALRSLQAAFRRSIEPAATNGTKGLLPFRNGCLVLDDLRLIPHDAAHGNTWALPYDYNPAATCPNIEAFLKDRLGDTAGVALFRAFCRALLTRERLKCFLEIVGASNSGKSVLGNLLRAVVGEQNAAAGTLQRLEDRAQRFETAKFVGKLLAIFNECQDYNGRLETLKAMTGDDAIGAEIKGGRAFDFTYRGGVVLVGNGPIRASDPSGAVINRRRSLIVSKVVAAGDERRLLESDGNGGWEGELADELPGLVNWALQMTPGEARSALARDVRSISRAESKLEMLLATDSLADWAEQNLIWDTASTLRVGVADGDPDLFLFPSYLRFMAQQGSNSRPLSLKTFKAKLVGLLRDGLALPLPAGHENSGDYRQRGLGSVVPCLRFRRSDEDDAPGVIRHAVLAAVSGTDQAPSGTGAERVGNGKTPAGNGWNGCNGSEPIKRVREKSSSFAPYTEERTPEPVPSVPSVPYKGSHRSAPVPEPARPVPQGVPVEVQDAKTGEWEPGWHQLTNSSGSGSLLCSDPRGQSRQVERKRIRRALNAEAA